MTSRLYDEMEVRRALMHAIKDAGSQAAFADVAKVSERYIRFVLNGDRSPGEKITRVLGFDRVVRYVRKTPSKGGLP